jgi:hypothetical protein
MATKRWIGWAAALAGGLMFASAAWAAKPATETSTGKRTGEAFQWSRVIPVGKEIEIKGVNGDISATRATGKEVEVRATKRAHRSDPDEVTIEVVEHDDGVTICARYPGSDNECGPGNKGRMNTHNNDVRVDFEVKVPAGVRLSAHTVNGDIQADDLQSPVDAATVNGAVHVSTSAYASAATVNGSIDAALGSAEWTEPISFNTVNGAIHLTLPAQLDADVRCQTLNGTVDSAFPVTVTGKLSRHSMHGTIGKGGRRLDLETLNGNIVLRSGS